MAFSFPVMPLSQLVQVLNDVSPDLNVTDGDFQKPTGDRWIQIYLYFLKHLLGVTHTMLAQPNAQLTQYRFEYPEVHENSTFNYMLALAMQRLMLMCGVDNFTYRNISNPTTKRCIYIMSALVNYTNFHDGRLQDIEEIKTANEEVLRARRTKLERVEELTKKIEQVKQSRAQIHEETKELQLQQENHACVLTTKQQEGSEKHKSFSEMKKQLASAEASNASVKEKMATKKAEIDRLSRLIVQSPERKKREMEHIGKQLGMLKKDQEQRQRRLVELKNQIADKESQMERTDRVVKILPQIQTFTQKAREATASIKKMQETQSSIQEQFHDLETRLLQLKRHLSAKQDKLNKMVLQAETKDRSMKEARDQMFSEMKHMQASQSEEDQEIHELEQEINRLRQIDASKAEKFEKEINIYKEDHAKLMQSLDEYHGRLTKAYEKIRLKTRTTQCKPV